VVTDARRIADALAASAIRHAGRCTWVADEPAEPGRARTVGPELATGAAGIGWFLARFAASGGDRSAHAVAVAALRTAAERAPALVAAGRTGFHDGAAGVAWAALDAGDVLGADDLGAEGRAVAERVLEADVRPDAFGLFSGGTAGVVVGLVALADRLGDARFLDAAAEPAGRLAVVAGELARAALRGAPPSRGLALGASGVALALLGFARAAGDDAARSAAGEAARAERAWSASTGRGELVAHPWLHPAARAGSWCGGAVGVAHARLLDHALTGALQPLAEVAAALGGPLPAGGDGSLCHGLAGRVDLLVTAGLALREPAHLAAARRLARRLPGPAPGNPTLLLGDAGVGLALLRAHEPARIGNPLLPVAVDRRA
jgi:lantibiotic modifying enzyme